jgi:hypothetical protein
MVFSLIYGRRRRSRRKNRRKVPFMIDLFTILRRRKLGESFTFSRSLCGRRAIEIHLKDVLSFCIMIQIPAVVHPMRI